MEEENMTKSTEGAPMSEGEPSLGKFKSVDALLHAYGELEAEFTRRSQRLKTLEAELASAKEAQAAPREELPCASTEAGPQAQEAPEAVEAPPVRVPLMGAGGAGVVSPKSRPRSITEAGALALGYLKRSRNSIQ